MSRLFIGVAGGSGSGKSTFTNRLKDEFGDKVTVIYYDNYYKAHHDIPFEGRKLINYDHPDAFETDLLISHLRELRNGNSIECPVYDFTVHDRSDKVMTIEPSDIMIIEGIMVLQNEQLRDLLDIKIFVDADADERILRRVIRDVRDRERDVEGIARQYLNTVKPMHYIYVEPTKYMADIVMNSGKNDVVFDIISVKIRSVLAENGND
ncbi:MAG: uridine kinase [Clostridiales bacterium]|nr:uridine kinase [Clostridiales bacterium]